MANRVCLVNIFMFALLIVNLACLNPTYATGNNETSTGGINSFRPCIVSNAAQNISGICQPLLDCSANIGLLRAGVIPTFCSTGPGEKPGVVCCPKEERISIKKCEEFSSILTQPLKAKQALAFDGKTSEKELNDKSIKCEVFHVSFITGGRTAEEREYPYQVALGFGDKSNPDWRCGGTLIDSQHVLTAAHCIQTSYGPPKVILMGDRQISTRKDASRLLMNISEIYLHPKYKPPLQYNDIAIIKLEKAVSLSRSVLPACLPNPADRLDRALGVEATGWGQVGAMEGQSDTLQSVTLAKFETEECTSFFAESPGNKERLPDGILRSQFCAGDKQGFRDTCRGDSGGPLTVSKENNSCVRYIVGITSFGSKMCGYQQPGVYTNVLSYLDWIESIVWFNNIGKSKPYTNQLPENHDMLFMDPSVESSTPSTTPRLTSSEASTKPVSITGKPTSKPLPSSTVQHSTTIPTSTKAQPSSSSPTPPTTKAQPSSSPTPPTTKGQPSSSTPPSTITNPSVNPVPSTTTTNPITTTVSFETILTSIPSWPSLPWNNSPDPSYIAGAISDLLQKIVPGSG